jgi:hypothetical protein
MHFSIGIRGFGNPKLVSRGDRKSYPLLDEICVDFLSLIPRPNSNPDL